MFTNLTIKLNKLSIFYSILTSIISSILVLSILNITLDTSILLIINKNILSAFIVT